MLMALAACLCVVQFAYSQADQRGASPPVEAAQPFPEIINPSNPSGVIPAAGVAEAADPPAQGAGAPQAPAAAPAPGLTPLPTMILEMVNALGVWTVPFALTTLVAIWYTTERLVVLRRGRVIPRPFVQRFLKLLEEGEMDRDYALQVCEENGSPVALVFAHGVRKWGKPSVEVEQAIIDGGERQVAVLRNNLRVISGVAQVAPLLGLLGTVWGMLESFNKIAEAGAMGKADQLAAGIALALVTTAAGLVIAIPTLVAHMYLSGRVDALVMEMDDLAQKVVNLISAESLSEQGARPRKKEPELTRKRAAV
jgi:biopolymer transport protein ExbB